MKYCTHCGNQLDDAAVICPKCGCAVDGQKTAEVANGEKKFTGLQLAAFILMIISTVSIGWMLIPLAWCIPMTISYYNSIKNGRPVSLGLKVCTLLFVNLISGILMLCDNE
ncbi:MAG: zinc-ribbon domain-containing protein [Clostridia bacterium]|nr:zinc-ribbon domain-containing protein [Clostridia bacterium]